MGNDPVSEDDGVETPLTEEEKREYQMILASKGFIASTKYMSRYHGKVK